MPDKDAKALYGPEEEDKDEIVIYKNGKPVGKVSNKDGHTDAATVQSALVEMGDHAGKAKDIKKQIKKLEKKMKDIKDGKAKKSGKSMREQTEMLQRDLRELRRRLIEEQNAAKAASAFTADEDGDAHALEVKKHVALDQWKSKWVDPRHPKRIDPSIKPYIKGHHHRRSIKERAASAFGRVLWQTTNFHRTADARRENERVSRTISDQSKLSMRFREKIRRGFLLSMVADNYGDRYRLRLGHNEVYRPETVREHHFRIAQEKIEAEIEKQEKKRRKAEQKRLVEELRKNNQKLPGQGGIKEFTLENDQVVEKSKVPSSLPPIAGLKKK